MHEMSSGEVAFAPPLPLKLLKRSNLRSGPTISSKVQRVLEKGTKITGLSHKDEWIHINTTHGESGWIHQSLVDTR
jgi:SH3-like domain-containing protein